MANDNETSTREYYRDPGDANVLNSKNAVAVAYGHSDDLVEFDGLLYDEVGAFYSEGTEVLLSNGVHFRANYDENGVWRFLVLAGADKVTLDRLPTEGEDDDTGRYTDYLWIHASDEQGQLTIVTVTPDEEY